MASKNLNFIMFKRFIRKILPSKSDFEKSIQQFLLRNVGLNSSSPLILIWELGGFPAILEKNAIFSIALNLRGYKTHFIFCDGLPEACIQRGLEQNEVVAEWKKRCEKCCASMQQTAKRYRLDYSFVSDHISSDKQKKFKLIVDSTKLDEIIKYKFFDVNVGELAWSSTNRYMKGFLVNFENVTKDQEIIYRKYFYAALVNTYVAQNVIEKMKPVSLVTSHGVYVDYAPPVMVAFNRGIYAVSWASGFANFLHYFTIPKGANKLELRGMSKQSWEKRKSTRLTAGENQRLSTFINDRYFKAKARDINILSQPEEEHELKEKLGIKNSNPIVCLFTHVNWDACFDLSTMLFESANQWVIESIKKMISIVDVNWIVRVHPGEITDGSLFTTDDVIKKEFQCIPEHIKILWSHSSINTYSLYKLIDVGITIFGTVGVELPLFGKPIIAAGNAHFSGKDFSFDAQSKDEYFALLENVKKIGPLQVHQIELAKKYAYSYFIQRQVPINAIDKAKGHWGGLDIRKLQDLLPGNDPIMDAICEGIIRGNDIILEESVLEKSNDCVSA